MTRPSNQIDQALLTSGRALFPCTGCAGLSLRALAEHAGVNVGMFHYHFKTKDNFLRTLLQQMYEEMFAGLQWHAGHDGPAVQRLRAALLSLARFARDHRHVLARIWLDALGGQRVALEFLAANAPRHIALLLALSEQAHAEGALIAVPQAQRLALLLGAIVMPMVFVAGLADAEAAPAEWRRAMRDDVLSDAAIEQRIDLALGALRAVPAAARTRRKGVAA